MTRAILLVLDSFGVGNAADAADYGDEGADTFGHIAKACAAGKGNKPGLRTGPLRLPNMTRLGLVAAHKASHRSEIPALPEANVGGLWGYAAETSNGKDTPSGHWEIAGVPVRFDWGYFPDTEPCFPKDLTDQLIATQNLPGILGNKHASGTVVIEEFGEEHLRTGKPIFYTSTDSVLQIAAHEEQFGLERLYRLCEAARVLVDPLNIGRVIARPFLGASQETFARTGNRRDYSVLPPEPTLLDRVQAAGRQMIAIGKISDIYAHQGVTRSIKANGNTALFDATLDAMDLAGDGDMIFTNLVDFDMLYGHRRDVPGYAAALEALDARLPELEARLQAGDLLILTADHGCDPTWPGTDHTREHVPILMTGPEREEPALKGHFIGPRPTFADIGETIADHLGLPAGPHGTSFLPKA